jgi:hypothetical protein
MQCCDRPTKAIASLEYPSIDALRDEAIEHRLEEHDQQEIIHRSNLDTLDEL